jgi:hypothetical protein
MRPANSAYGGTCALHLAIERAVRTNDRAVSGAFDPPAA